MVKQERCVSGNTSRTPHPDMGMPRKKEYTTTIIHSQVSITVGDGKRNYTTSHFYYAS